MACFIVPATEAIITTVATKVVESKEKKAVDAVDGKDITISADNTVKFSQKLKMLNGLLWGGSGLLAFEHFWHGEIQPFAPFLTAASSKADTVEMLHEMSTVGVSMALLITAVWGAITLVSSKVTSKNVSVSLEDK